MENLFLVLQDIRAQLELWGVTTEFLIFAALLTLALFMLSLREVAAWFFKVQTLRDEVRDLKLKLSEMHEVLKVLQARGALAPDVAGVGVGAVEASAACVDAAMRSDAIAVDVAAGAAGVGAAAVDAATLEATSSTKPRLFTLDH